MLLKTFGYTNFSVQLKNPEKIVENLNSKCSEVKFFKYGGVNGGQICYLLFILQSDFAYDQLKPWEFYS